MKHLSPTDSVPSLRSDLVLSERPTGSGAEVIHLRPVGSRESAELHGFELSLARMLDGRRTVREVLTRAGQLGLPLTLAALEGFIGHLEGQGLLARDGRQVRGPVSPWNQRTPWDPTIRAQYQAALKALRSGHVDDAKVLLDQLLASAPTLEEARELKGWLVEHPSGVVAGGQTFRQVYSRTERDWLGSVTPLDPHVKLEREDLRAVRRSAGPMVAVAAVLLIGAAALLVPIPAQVHAPAQLTPITVTEVAALHDGTLAESRVQDGQWVHEGDVLFTFEDELAEPVTAPHDGKVTGLYARQGAVVSAGQELVELQDPRTLKVTARVDSREALVVKPGQKATIALGHQSEVTTVAEVNGRDVSVTQIDNTAGRLEPGRAVLDIDIGPRSLLQRIR